MVVVGTRRRSHVPVLGLVLIGESGAIGTLTKLSNLLLLFSTNVLTQSQ